MSGVRCGTRLEQLERLAAQVQLEIELERRRLALHDTSRSNTPARPVRFVRSTADVLEELGVTAVQVKRWAVNAGLLETVARGRIARWVVDAYAESRP